MDVLWPMGSHGRALAYASAVDRLRSDSSMSLALLHHLVGRQAVSFELFAEITDSLSRHTAIIEFVPADDVHVRHWPIARQPWYNADRFIAAMKPYFARVDVLPSSPEPRQLLLFRRS
jgi:hypothetical protein